MVTPITGAVAGSAFTFAGTLTGYASAPTLVYSLDSGPATAVTGVTPSGWSMTVVAPAAGAHVVSPAASFTVAPVTVSHAIAIANLVPVGGSAGYVFYDTFTSLADVTDTGGPPLVVTTITATPAGQSFTDATGGVWTIVGGAALLNGVSPAFSANVQQLSLVNGTVWQENTTPSWYFFTASPASWTPANSPFLGGTAGSWMNHYPFGGSEYTLSANGELEYFSSTSRTGYSPFSLQNGGVGPGLGLELTAGEGVAIDLIAPVDLDAVW